MEYEPWIQIQLLVENSNIKTDIVQVLPCGFHISNIMTVRSLQGKGRLMLWSQAHITMLTPEVSLSQKAGQEVRLSIFLDFC